MEMLVTAIAWTFIFGGVGFFLTSALGLLRFPDLYTRLHAVTKGDTIALGLLASGLAMLAANWRASLLMLLIWLLVMAASATSCQILARYCAEQQNGEERGPRAGPDF
jgi:multicomponent Na+:H+ antiporter subunit G